MKHYDLGDARAGTTVTFTGRGALDKKGRLVHALTVAGFAAIFVVATSLGYFMAQTASRPSAPRPARPAMPSASTPGGSAGSTRPSQPVSTSQPAISPSSSADQVGRGAAPEGPPPGRQGAPASSAGHSGDAQQGPDSPLVASRGTPQQRSSASPAMLAPPSRFHIQSGAFVNRDNAVALVMRLRDRGYAATLIEGPLYRVWVGGSFDRTTAERLAANLQAMGFDATLIPR